MQTFNFLKAVFRNFQKNSQSSFHTSLMELSKRFLAWTMSEDGN